MYASTRLRSDKFIENVQHSSLLPFKARLQVKALVTWQERKVHKGQLGKGGPEKEGQGQGALGPPVESESLVKRKVKTVVFNL